MSTEIKKINGTCHYHIETNKCEIEHRSATVSLTRFYNRKEHSTNIQLTVNQDAIYGTSYIHLNKEQCYELAKALLNSFDYDIYPAD